MASHVPDYAWIKYERVIRLIAEEIWKKFPEDAKRKGRRIIWEFGTVEAVVDVALHGEQAPEWAHQIFKNKLRTEPVTMSRIVPKAAGIAARLVESPAYLLLLMGADNCSKNPAFSRDAALQEIAADIFDGDYEEFSRRFERARIRLKKALETMNKREEERLREIGELGRASRTNPKVASKYPKVFKWLDNQLRAKETN